MKYSELVAQYLVAIGSRAEDAPAISSLDCHRFAEEVNHKTGMDKNMIHLALDGIGDFPEVARAHIEEVTGVSLGSEPNDDVAVAEAAERQRIATEAADAENERAADELNAEADREAAEAVEAEANRVAVAEALAITEREAAEAAEAEDARVAATAAAAADAEDEAK